MFARLFRDWKFLLMLAATVAGVIGPYWLWRADQSGKSISVTVLSEVSLQPKEKDSVQGLEITIKGLPLAEPFLSVFRLSNDGKKPIATSDFESPLEIRVLSKSTVVRARVTEKSPEDIDAEITWDKQAIRLKPTLLNPKDSITLSVVTSGGAPRFGTKARILGISSVPLVDATKPVSSPWKKWVFLAAALLFGTLTMGTSPIDLYLDKKLAASVRRRTLLLNALVTGFTAMLFVIQFLSEFGVDSFWYSWLSTMALFIVSSPLASKWGRLVKVNESSSNQNKP